METIFQRATTSFTNEQIAFTPSHPYWLDIECFETTLSRHLQVAEEHLTEEAADQLTKAVALYAAELLEVADEAGMDQFLGRLSNKAQRKLRRALKPRVRRTLFRGLKGLARRALPLIWRRGAPSCASWSRPTCVG